MDSTLQGTPVGNMVSPAAIQQQQQQRVAGGGSPAAMPPPPDVAKAPGLMEALWNSGVWSVEPEDMLKELAVQYASVWKLEAGEARNKAEMGLNGKII